MTPASGIAGVGKSQAATGQASEVLVGSDDHDGLAHLFRLHCGDDSGRRAAIDDEIVIGGNERLGQHAQGGSNSRQEAHEQGEGYA